MASKEFSQEEQEERYINFLKNYNKKLREKNTDWLGPDDFGDVIIQTAEQNIPGCVRKILEEAENIKNENANEEKIIDNERKMAIIETLCTKHGKNED